MSYEEENIRYSIIDIRYYLGIVRENSICCSETEKRRCNSFIRRCNSFITNIYYLITTI